MKTNFAFEFYVYLIGENVGNFLTDARDSIVTHITWNAIVTHASHQRFPTAFT